MGPASATSRQYDRLDASIVIELSVRPRGTAIKKDTLTYLNDDTQYAQLYIKVVMIDMRRTGTTTMIDDPIGVHEIRLKIVTVTNLETWVGQMIASSAEKEIREGTQMMFGVVQRVVRLVQITHIPANRPNRVPMTGSGLREVENPA